MARGREKGKGGREGGREGREGREGRKGREMIAEFNLHYTFSYPYYTQYGNMTVLP